MTATHPSKRIRVGILGVKGYTGGELLRLLAHHPRARPACLMARVEQPETVASSFPALRGLKLPPIEPIDLESLAGRCDVVFLALPHTVAQEYAPALIDRGVKVVDLSADFRFASVEQYEQTYKVRHLAPQLNDRIPYGLPELFRNDLIDAPAIANPGCHTTTAILGLAPLMKRPDDFDFGSIVINSLTGVSGGGRKPTDKFHFPEANESVQAYGVASHRHRPEIEEQLTRLAGRPIRVTFTPVLIPMNRGILSCISVKTRRPVQSAEALEWFADQYSNEPFIRVLPKSEFPSTAQVQYTNYCDIGVAVDPHTQTLLVFGATDNLMKGASGQAIQNMNILFGFPETEGLLPENKDGH